MTSDAKMGLMAGVAAVVMVAVVYFPKPAAGSATAAVSPPGDLPQSKPAAAAVAVSSAGPVHVSLTSRTKGGD
jgi:hypothetical protein